MVKNEFSDTENLRNDKYPHCCSSNVLFPFPTNNNFYFRLKSMSKQVQQLWKPTKWCPYCVLSNLFLLLLLQAPQFLIFYQSNIRKKLRNPEAPYSWYAIFFNWVFETQEIHYSRCSSKIWDTINTIFKMRYLKMVEGGEGRWKITRYISRWEEDN